MTAGHETESTTSTIERRKLNHELLKHLRQSGDSINAENRCLENDKCMKSVDKSKASSQAGYWYWQSRNHIASMGEALGELHAAEKCE